METDDQGHPKVTRPQQGTPQGGVLTPPTILQAAPLGASVKRERIDPVYHADLRFVYLHSFHERELFLYV